MSKDSSLITTYLIKLTIQIKENVVKNEGPIIDVCTGAPPDVVTALSIIKSHFLVKIILKNWK